jgi:ATP-dependent Clp endopeptidase proteolytic subunit ClpP
MPGRDRYRFLGRMQKAEKAPILAAAPEPRQDGSVATMRLYDPIDSWGGYWGVSAKEFVAALDALPADTAEIQLLINSPGGDVFEGLAILNALRRHSAKVTTVVEGLAASAASFVALGGDEVVMARNAELMVHDAWGVVVGNAEDMAQMATNLNRISDNIASIYADKSGGAVADWRAIMRAETWYSATEAVDAGLADRIDGAAAADAQTKARFDLSIFTYAGREAAPPPPAARAAAPDPSPAPAVESVASGDTPQSPRSAAVLAALLEAESIESASTAA